LAGVYTLTLTANNGVAPTASQTLTLIVSQAPAFTSPSGVTFQQGVAGNFQVVASGFPAPTLSLSGPLPAGMIFDPSTGLLRGTPRTAGLFHVYLRAVNGLGATVVQPFTLTVV
jgi:hypothetical protein